jgi:hypothetical protein
MMATRISRRVVTSERKEEMIRLALALLIVTLAASTAFAEWQLYGEDTKVIASFDIASFAPFRGKPSVWVRWNYVTPRNGVGGVQIHFMADCAAQGLYEIASNPYDPEGNYLTSSRSYDKPKEYAVTPGSLNEATYNLLCR